MLGFTSTSRVSTSASGRVWAAAQGLGVGFGLWLDFDAARASKIHPCFRVVLGWFSFT